MFDDWWEEWTAIGIDNVETDGDIPDMILHLSASNMKIQMLQCGKTSERIQWLFVWKR